LVAIKHRKASADRLGNYSPAVVAIRPSSG
jgi:hypothetical protein